MRVKMLDKIEGACTLTDPAEINLAISAEHLCRIKGVVPRRVAGKLVAVDLVFCLSKGEEANLPDSYARWLVELQLAEPLA